jgi:hypothetical protein
MVVREMLLLMLGGGRRLRAALADSAAAFDADWPMIRSVSPSTADWSILLVM